MNKRFELLIKKFIIGYSFFAIFLFFHSSEADESLFSNFPQKFMQDHAIQLSAYPSEQEIYALMRFTGYWGYYMPYSEFPKIILGDEPFTGNIITFQNSAAEMAKGTGRIEIKQDGNYYQLYLTAVDKQGFRKIIDILFRNELLKAFGQNSIEVHLDPPFFEKKISKNFTFQGNALEPQTFSIDDAINPYLHSYLVIAPHFTSGLNEKDSFIEIFINEEKIDHFSLIETGPKKYKIDEKFYNIPLKITLKAHLDPNENVDISKAWTMVQLRFEDEPLRPIDHAQLLNLFPKNINRSDIRTLAFQLTNITKTVLEQVVKIILQVKVDPRHMIFLYPFQYEQASNLDKAIVFNFKNEHPTIGEAEIRAGKNYSYIEYGFKYKNETSLKKILEKSFLHETIQNNIVLLEDGKLTSLSKSGSAVTAPTSNIVGYAIMGTTLAILSLGFFLTRKSKSTIKS
ncbi:MAG: hypothetical protein BGO10_10325 [Chlamydia sp. 32-24]|nr:MAG: hypothetical protein BGO10_10325 [Chlamydia sp. 32-24]